MEQIAPTLQKIVSGSLKRASDSPALAWPLACGSTVAERTRVVGFNDGVLRVEVPDRGWRAELQNLGPRYLSAINRYSARPVDRIEFVLGESKIRK